MKESWMEKLIELLNEFEEYNKNCEFDEVYNYYPYRIWYEWDFETDLTKNCMNITFIMSKTFWFIKWLVENDKIDISKLWKKSDMWFGDKYTREESLLMLLAISKNPIKELISYLK